MTWGLIPVLQRLHDDNYSVYEVRKIWHATGQAGWEISRDQCARLMRVAGIEGVRRGHKPTTTRPAAGIDNRPDLVDRHLKAAAPNLSWVADVTYVCTTSEFCYTAFVTDVCPPKIVGWATRSAMRTEALFLEAPGHALIVAKDQSVGAWSTVPTTGSQYVGICYTEHLKEAGIKPSARSTGDSYDNALAETAGGLHKAELIYAWAALARRVQSRIRNP